ncbi:hypothetical protein EN844_06560 [Mesorhizobium sp. M3A.F.Ca.ET.201.01.1.1]|uniref:hypothetical protein n=1 Tax=Mesorhizobium sp. M3A.F.Ca.ET.201.01.1.1 TaxID=2563946 RepID=UPI0010937ED9|nr:hypothetical protein [Mesorhizobium sp. M3A.F.Ca.ET.201.01.1.1]TGS70398.1 hypothetical protein EN844_06560 [Mesorhizobium sp. M3A.F.Ca.ET.201.01.1.1]
MSKINFAAFRNAWLDQVATDNTLAPLAFKLGWHFMKDCGRTLSKQGAIFSFRSQDGYAELLGIKTRHVRDLFTALRDRGHITVKRAGKGNPNRTFPTLFDRQNSAGQNDAMTGTFVPYDRHSDDIMTGTKVPGNLIEDISEEIQGRAGSPSPASLSSSTIPMSSSTLNLAAKGDARAPLASPSPRSVNLNHESWKDEDDEGPVEYDGPEDEPGGESNLWSDLPP